MLDTFHNITSLTENNLNNHQPNRQAAGQIEQPERRNQVSKSSEKIHREQAIHPPTKPKCIPESLPEY